MRAARDGDRGGGEQLFRRFAPMALRCARGMCRGNEAEAEDLVQDVFVNCLTRIEELREPERFGAWLMRSLRNRAINRTASQQSRDRALGKLAVVEATVAVEDPLAEVMREERRALVKRTHDALEAGPIKEAAELFYFEELEVSAVAERLGIPKSTVTTRLDRFRQAFKKQLLREVLKRQRAGGAGPDSGDPSEWRDPREVV